MHVLTLKSREEKEIGINVYKNKKKNNLSQKHFSNV